MKTLRKVLALAVSAAMLTVPALAAEAEADSAKEEVVYITLTADGAADTIDVVNIFDLPEGGTIEDHGAYTSVRNMTTEDDLTLDGDTVTAEAGPGRLYYEGRLEGAVSPWKVSIEHTLDGETVPAEDLAGAGGAWEMHMTVEADPACEGSWFDDMALQIAVTLDTARCSDIQAPGATAANVGSDKQFTYTVLPGQGADITLSAQVTDFELEPIALNGVALRLDLQLDGGSLTEKLEDLPDAIADLDDGAAALSEGVAALAEGAGTLSEGAGSVSDGAADAASGAETLNSGIATLQSGASQFAGGLSSLTGQSAALTEGSAAVKEGLTQLQQSVDASAVTPEQIASLQTAASSVSLALEQMDAAVTDLQAGVAALPTDQLWALQQQNTGAIEQLNALAQVVDPDTAAAITSVSALLQANNDALTQISGALAGVDTLAAGVADLRLAFDTFSGDLTAMIGGLGSLPDNMAALKTAVDALVTGYDSVDAGVAAYTAGAAQLEQSFGAIASGAADLAAGSASLASGTAALSTGAADLAAGVDSAVAGIGELQTGSDALTEGTAALREETDGMAQRIDEELDDLLGGLTGGDEKPLSFASAENGTVEAVQFVMKTPAIAKPAPAAPEPTPATERSFWDRLTDLF